MVKALDRVSEISGVGVSGLDLDAVPQRRLVELARYGLAGKTTLLKRHPAARRHATLLATVRYLEGKATDDALELLDLLITSELVGHASRAADKQTLRDHGRLAQASATLAAAVEVLLGSSGQPERASLEDVWEAVDAVAPRAVLHAAVATVGDLVPPGGDADGEWRALLSRRIVTVSGFLRVLTGVVDFGADPEAAAVLAARKEMPTLLEGRRKLTVTDIDTSLVSGSWKHLVFGHPPDPGGAIDKNAYVFFVLTQFHRHLKRRGIYAPGSTRWTDPRAQLLSRPAWACAEDAVLTTLRLPDEPAVLLAEQAQALDDAY